MAEVGALLDRLSHEAGDRPARDAPRLRVPCGDAKAGVADASSVRWTGWAMTHSSPLSRTVCSCASVSSICDLSSSVKKSLSTHRKRSRVCPRQTSFARPGVARRGAAVVAITLRVPAERTSMGVATAPKRRTRSAFSVIRKVTTPASWPGTVSSMSPGSSAYRVSKMIKEDMETGRLPKAIPVFLLTARNLSSDHEREGDFRSFKAFFMTVWRSSSRNAENGSGIRRDRRVAVVRAEVT